MEEQIIIEMFIDKKERDKVAYKIKKNNVSVRKLHLKNTFQIFEDIKDHKNYFKEAFSSEIYKDMVLIRDLYCIVYDNLIKV